MRQIVPIITFIVALGVGGYVLMQKPTPTKSQLQPNSPATQTQAANTYTKEQVAQHNTADSCWAIIDDAVYDITSYISRHDGGDEILRACGTDATDLFHNRRTNDGQTIGTGTPHSGMASSHLSQLQLGSLSQQ